MCAARLPTCRPHVLPSARRAWAASARSQSRGHLAIARSVDLEDACASPAPTLSERRADIIANYKMITTVNSWPEYPEGATILVEPLRPDSVEETAGMLSAAFVESRGPAFKAYATFLRKRICSYLEEHRTYLPKAVVLTAVLQAGSGTNITGDSDDGSSSTDGSITGDRTCSSTRDSSVSSTHKQPVNGEQVIVGTAEVSFARETHSTYLTLNPPKKCAYLCNMAVSPKWQRRGVGKLLMRAVEDVVRLGGEQELYLHVRQQDKPAAQLYLSTGFQEAASDNFLVLLLGQDMRRLMVKRVAPCA